MYRDYYTFLLIYLLVRRSLSFSRARASAAKSRAAAYATLCPSTRFVAGRLKLHLLALTLQLRAARTSKEKRELRDYRVYRLHAAEELSDVYFYVRARGNYT